MKNFIEVTHINPGKLTKKVILNIDKIIMVAPVGYDNIGCMVRIGEISIRIKETYDEFINILFPNNLDKASAFYCCRCGKKLTGDCASYKDADGKEKNICLDCFDFYLDGANYEVKDDE